VIPTEAGSRWIDDRIALRPVAPPDEEFFRRIETDPDIGPRYRLRGTTPSPENYHQSLWVGVLSQQVICASDDLTPFGLACAFNADLRNGHCRLALVLTPRAQTLRYPLRGAGQFVDYLFATFPLRKVYMDVMEWNVPLLDSILETGLAQEEGVLRQLEFMDGAYRDSHIWSISREAWEQFSSGTRDAWGDASAAAAVDDQQILSALADLLNLDIEELSPDKDLVDDLAADSLALAQVVLLIEEFGGELADGAIQAIRTVGDVVTLSDGAR